MRRTLTLDDSLIDKARVLTGLVEESALIHEGLRALITRESARKLAALGGTERKLCDAKRRRLSGRRSR